MTITEEEWKVGVFDSDPLVCEFSVTGQHTMVCGGVSGEVDGYWWYCDNGMCQYEQEGW
jgi:hypothetical protein